MERNPPLISVVIPLLNEAECLRKLHGELHRVCEPLAFHFEFLFVDDGSTDDSLLVLDELCRRDKRVCYLALSRNFGHQAALSAGLDYASGSAVIMMDCDLQHPPELIPELVRKWLAGHEVVNTVRLDTVQVNLVKRAWSYGFYRLFSWATKLRIEPGSADFRLVSRSVVEVLKGLPERHRFLRGLVPWLGFRQTTIRYHAPSRWAGSAKYTFGRSLRLALDGMTAFSFYPLRLLGLAGYTITLLAFLYGVYSVAMYLFTRSTVPGWASQVVCVTFLGGCQMAMLGILGEYIGRILEQVKGRPIYVVRQLKGLLSLQASEASGSPVVHIQSSQPDGASVQPLRRAAS